MGGDVLAGLLAGSPVATRLGKLLHRAAEEAVKKHEKDLPQVDVARAFSDMTHLKKCVGTLELMADLQDVMRAGEQVYKLFIAARVDLVREGTADKEAFHLEGLDDEGRPIYRSATSPEDHAYLRWSKVRQGGLWMAHTDLEGNVPGDLQLNSSLPTDLAVWEDSEGNPAEGVRCLRGDKPLLSLRDASALEGCWARNDDCVGLCRDLAQVLDEIGLGERRVVNGHTLLSVLHELLLGMCRLAKRLQIGDPYQPTGPTWPEFFRSVESLASLPNTAVWKTMSEALPFISPGFDLSWVQCMVRMCRVLKLSDMCDPSETWLLRFFHRFFLRSWQSTRSVGRVLDIDRMCHTESSPTKRRRGMVRSVVVSDTHGWDADLVLPPGNILFHCGDLLFEGSGLEPGGTAPRDLKRALQTLHQPMYRHFDWVFVIGGNHDRGLHEMWASHPEMLCMMLPPNVVILQTPADLTPALPTTGLARNQDVRDCIRDGAIKLSADLSVHPPSGTELGCVIAGSGVSLANSKWTGNKAFQLLRDDSAALERAAKALVQHQPSIVMTHGPPKGHCDLGRGDASLAQALLECQSVRVHLFGHVHETYGVDFTEKCTYVNASLSNPLFIPSEDPVVFDIDPALFGSV